MSLRTNTAGSTNELITILIVVSVFCTISALYFVWSWSPVLAGFGGDNALYFHTANFLSPYSRSLVVSTYFASHNPYPPLYPFLLAVLGGGNSILLAHLITTTFLLLAMLIMYRWLIYEKPGCYHALVLIIIFAMIPGAYIQALSIHSENLYLLFSMSALYVVAIKGNKGNWLWVAALLIACSSMTRSAGVSLLMAFIIYLFIKKEREKYLLSFTALLPITVWAVFNNQSGISYVTLFSDYYSANFINLLLQQFTTQSVHLLNAWQTTFTFGKFGHVLLSIFAGICIAGMFYRLYMKELDGLYAFLYILMILIWPYPAESMRLLFPVIPVLLVQTSMCVNCITKRWYPESSRSGGNIIIQGILLIIMVPNLVLTVNRFNTTIDAYLNPYKRTYAWYDPVLPRAIEGIKFNHVIVTSLIDAKTYVPEDQCVYSIKPSVIGVYMERISKEPPAVNIDDIDFYRALEQSNCRYFYFISGYAPSYNKVLYPLERVRENLEVIKIYYDSDQRHIISILGKLKN